MGRVPPPRAPSYRIDGDRYYVDNKPFVFLEPRQIMRGTMSHQPKAPVPDDCIGGYGYRADLPVQSAAEYWDGIYWRWDFDARYKDGMMACYRTKLPFWRRLVRRAEMYLSVTGWILSGPPKKTKPKQLEPLVLPEFSYPPGLDLDAFFFRLDLRGNPRDVGFEWAWMRPLLPVPKNPIRSEAERQRYEDEIMRPIMYGTTPIKPPEPYVEPQPRDAEFDAYMESEYVTLEEYRAVQRGEMPTLRKRLQDFDDRYQRPVCRCGRSHPQLHTPMRYPGPGKHDWHYKRSYYRCDGCGREWQTGNLKAALEMKPLVKPVRLRKEPVPQSNELPEQLLKPPAVT